MLISFTVVFFFSRFFNLWVTSFNRVSILEEDRGSSEILPPQAPSVNAFENTIPSESPINTEEEEKSGSPDELPSQKPKDSRKIVQVMVIYDDDTFRTFAPAF